MRRGALFFGHFLLGKQKKAARPKGRNDFPKVQENRRASTSLVTWGYQQFDAGMSIPQRRLQIQLRLK